ncbi:alpha/beta fold hydrolase [Streptomyces sp. 049-1]|uniref:alpha/beta fold hydrolase n=1 Tax=Streptomyces sp. 049-1 TaxID=2789264 RepID=UPI0039809928
MQEISHGKVTVVLAHGAWADGSSWGKVIAGLRSQGVRSAAAPLPLTSLSDDVAALDRVLERIETPVVVVGHAYAGAVIASTNVPKVAALVYVAALAPDEGETVGDVFYRAKPHAKAPQLEPDHHGFIWLPEEAFAVAFAQQATPHEQEHLAAVQRPLGVASIGAPVSCPTWKDRPRWFLVAEDDRMIPAQTQRFMAQRMNARVRTSAADHMPMLTDPSAVVDIVMEAVSEVAAGR